MHNNEVWPCALKRMPYDSVGQKVMINAELAALKAVSQKPGVVQCLGVFHDWDRDSQQEGLWIVMRCVSLSPCLCVPRCHSPKL